MMMSPQFENIRLTIPQVCYVLMTATGSKVYVFQTWILGYFPVSPDATIYSNLWFILLKGWTAIQVILFWCLS